MIDWNRATLIEWYPKLAVLYAGTGLMGFWCVYLGLTI